LKKHSKSLQRSEPTLKRTKARGPVQRDAKEVLAEVLGKLTGKLDAPAVSTSAKENRRRNTVGPNRDRLTVGVDLGDRWSQYCILGLEGETLAEGQLRTTQEDVREFFQALTVARVVIEVGTHSAWVQDVITEWGHEVLVANPRLMEGSKRRKRKSDRIDANKIADCLRCDFLPECYMASTEIRERRRTLRYRNLLVHQAVQLKNKISGLLMEAGVSYNKQKLHKVGYFKELLAINPDINEGLKPLLRLCRETLVRLQKTESALVRSLQRDSLLAERVQRLMTIPAVGPITALTWALEVGDVKRFSSIKKAISYCGLCGAEKSSADTIKRTPISKQRNKHLQSVLVEAAKMAPRLSSELALIYDREKQKGNANRATLAVARKLVAYLVAIDRSQRDFLVVEKENCAAA